MVEPIPLTLDLEGTIRKVVNRYSTLGLQEQHRLMTEVQFSLFAHFNLLSLHKELCYTKDIFFRMVNSYIQILVIFLHSLLKIAC